VTADADLSEIEVVAECLTLLPRYSTAIGRRASTLLALALKQGNEQHGESGRFQFS